MEASQHESGVGRNGLIAMALSIDQEGGRFRVWCVCAPGSGGASSSSGARTLLLRVDDYSPSFCVPAPLMADRGGGGSGGGGDAEPREPTPAELQRLVQLVNTRMPQGVRVAAAEAITARPIMYYRPAAPDGAPYVRLTLRPGAGGDPVKRAAEALQRMMADGFLRGHGFAFTRGTEVLEADAKLLHRFLCDTALSGGAWLHVPPAGGDGGGADGSGAGYTLVAAADRVSTCDIEAVAPWRAVECLTPDATQLADADWKPDAVLRRQRRYQEQQQQDEGPDESGSSGSGGGEGSESGSGGVPAYLQAAAAAAAGGAIASLKAMAIDVQLATRDGAARTPEPGNADPIIAVACETRVVTFGRAATDGSSGDSGGSSSGNDGDGSSSTVVFLLAERPDGRPSVPPPAARAEGAALRFFATEKALLEAWRDHLLEADPDALVLFQSRDSLGAIAQRFAALRIDGGGAHVGRLARGCSRPLKLEMIVQYTPAWVKSQSRMSSTSNQATFRADVPGRLVFDVLRQVLTGQMLATFSLTDCVQSLLDETLEVLEPRHLAALRAQIAGAGGAGAGSSSDAAAAAAAASAARTAAAVRLARYTRRRLAAVWALAARLATLPESFEMARATGLTVQQVLFNAQMVRTWSLLHRAAHRRGYLIGGKGTAAPLTESPFLMHPVEEGTTGLYRSPVAVLDFASLYPSLYRAHNLCYSTLVHPSDAAALGDEAAPATPTGARFVSPALRAGVLPGILAALVTARAATRAQLKGERDPSQRAVLEGRQKALKLTANALYGFCGAAASPLQCVPLADSCLALGAATCRFAVTTIGELAAEGTLGPDAAGARVIYAQTDSVFLHLPAATPEAAVRVGQAAAAAVSARLRPPIELKFERVFAPLLLLQINRYAGRTFETAAQAAAAGAPGAGALAIKGLKAIWRQSAPFVQTTLRGALEAVLMRDDAAGAVAFAERQIARLLSGGVAPNELAMTGGLWRLTGAQVAAAAAAGAGGDDDDGDEPGGGAGGRPSDAAAAAAAAAAPPEDVKGPHASLAKRLVQRDPGRAFVTGERISYVLLAGFKKQDDAAEDPLTAFLDSSRPPPDYELYWKNKLQTPLLEILQHALTPAQREHLFNGPHTRVRGGGGAGGNGNGEDGGGGGLGDGAELLAPAGLASPPPTRGPRGGGASGASGSGQTAQTTPARGGRAGGAGGGGDALVSPVSSGKKRPASALQQGGMKSFFATTQKCLGCRRPMPGQPSVARNLFGRPGGGGGGSSAASSSGGPAGLCSDCLRAPGACAAAEVAALADLGRAEAAAAAAAAACARCHSGGHLLGPILCGNGECPVLYERIGAGRAGAAALRRLARLDASAAEGAAPFAW